MDSRALAEARSGFPVRAERALAPPLAPIVCTIPTWNESQNILLLARELLALGSDVQVLVIDDHSPDGTWRLVEEAARVEPRLFLLHRTRDKGRGRAGRDGFVRALEMGAGAVVEMDADFSHHPRFVPALVAELARPRADGRTCGLVLGSRAAPGGSDSDRGALRRLITKCANLYIRVLLGVGVRDCNSGFRCWRASTLSAIDVGRTASAGPAIVQELLFKAARAGIPIAEVGIEFVDRVRGESTLTWRILMQGYTTVLRLRWLALTKRL
jgi:dolichol-phosphate mannosyltransferase